MSARNPYARPAVEDRETLIDRILWAERVHPVITRCTAIFLGTLGAIVVAYQTWLAIERAVHDGVRMVGP